MGYEVRRNGLYYYRKRREGKRVVSEYVGGGAAGCMAALLDAEVREGRALERARLMELRGTARAVDALVADVDSAAGEAVAAAYEAAGYFKRRGEWRRKAA